MTKKRWASVAAVLGLVAILGTPAASPLGPPPAPTQATAGVLNFTDSLTPSDPVTTSNRLFRDSVATQCGVAKANPGNFGSPGNYKARSYRNWTSSPACVTFNITHTCGTAVHLHVVTAFDPSNPSSTYLGDQGSSISGQAFGITLEPGQAFTVVVLANFGVTTCSDYTVSITGGFIKVA